MRRQMTEAGTHVHARLRPFVAEFLSDVQLSLRFNSLSASTGGRESERIYVTLSFSLYLSLSVPRILLPLKSTSAGGTTGARSFARGKKTGQITTPLLPLSPFPLMGSFSFRGNDCSHSRVHPAEGLRWIHILSKSSIEICVIGAVFCVGFTNEIRRIQSISSDDQ
jgi:hypothetical protein